MGILSFGLFISLIVLLAVGGLIWETLKDHFTDIS